IAPYASGQAECRSQPEDVPVLEIRRETDFSSSLIGSRDVIVDREAVPERIPRPCLDANVGDDTALGALIGWDALKGVPYLGLKGVPYLGLKGVPYLGLKGIAYLRLYWTDVGGRQLDVDAPKGARFVQPLPRATQVRGGQHISGDELQRSFNSRAIGGRGIDRHERQYRSGARVRDDADIDAMCRLVERVFCAEV